MQKPLFQIILSFQISAWIRLSFLNCILARWNFTIYLEYQNAGQFWFINFIQAAQIRPVREKKIKMQWNLTVTWSYNIN